MVLVEPLCETMHPTLQWWLEFTSRSLSCLCPYSTSRLGRQTSFADEHSTQSQSQSHSRNSSAGAAQAAQPAAVLAASLHSRTSSQSQQPQSSQQVCLCPVRVTSLCYSLLFRLLGPLRRESTGTLMTTSWTISIISRPLAPPKHRY